MQPAALAAVKALHTDPGMLNRDGSVGVRRYSWVNSREVLDATTLAEALCAWRYTAYVNDVSGDITLVHFQGGTLGDDCTLWCALAPFMRVSDYIAFRGEDGDVWRWRVDADHTMCEDIASLVWNNDGESLGSI